MWKLAKFSPKQIELTKLSMAFRRNLGHFDHSSHHGKLVDKSGLREMGGQGYKRLRPHECPLLGEPQLLEALINF